MRNIPRVSLVALVATLLLSGCVPTEPATTPKPQPSSTPIFATEDEALAAATKAYAAYVKVSDQVFMDGGVNPERLKAVATGEQLKTNLAAFAEAAEKHLRSTGGTSFDTVSLQDLSKKAVDGAGIVVVYLCEDVTKVDVLNDQGVSVVSPTRPNRAGYQATFDLSTESSNILLLASKEPWTSLDC